MFEVATGCYAPNWPITNDKEPRMNIAKMGDGYEQRILDGLNWNKNTWQLKWSMRPRAIILDMNGYLLNIQAGSFPFYNPTTQLIENVFCDKWTITWNYRGNSADYGDLDAEFRSAFGDGIVGALL